MSATNTGLSDEPAIVSGGPQPSPNGFPNWAADLGARMALSVAAAALATFGAPTALVTAFSAAAAVAVVERLVRYRRRGMLDAALVGTGVLLVVLGLLGLVLNYLPGGITGFSWSIALVLLAIGSLTAVGLVDGETAPPSAFRPLLTRRSLPTLGWASASAAVLVIALVMSVQSFDRTHVAPVDISATSVSDGFATVTVSAGSKQGPYELDLVTTSGRMPAARNITVAAGTPVAVVVAVPSHARLLVQLVQPGTTTALRQLTFDSTAGATTVGATTAGPTAAGPTAAHTTAAGTTAAGR